jgi:hypothetical protein
MAGAIGLVRLRRIKPEIASDWSQNRTAGVEWLFPSGMPVIRSFCVPLVSSSIIYKKNTSTMNLLVHENLSRHSCAEGVLKAA